METTDAVGEGNGMGEEDGAVLQLLDSLDSYISEMASLQSSLRQGWFELSSARHSMGNSRISSSLFDMKPHSSATTVELSVSTDKSRQDIGENPVTCPQFSLAKWGSHGKMESSTVETDETASTASSSDEQEISAINGPASDVDGRIQKERSKALLMFGALVPPKLRLAQCSFETALEKIVEIANRRSTILSTLEHLQTIELGS